MKPAIDRRVAVRLAGVVVAALAVRCLFFWLRGAYLDWDEAMYLLIARSFLEGGGPELNGLPHTALGPFVPLASAAVSRFSGLELLSAQRMISALAGAFLIVPVWYLLRKSAGARVAWTAIPLLVAWPALIDVAPKLGPCGFTCTRAASRRTSSSCLPRWRAGKGPWSGAGGPPTSWHGWRAA